MTREEKIQELREKVAKELARQSRDYWWEKLSDLDKSSYLEDAGQILNLIRETCYLKADRELPNNPYRDISFQEAVAYDCGKFDMLTPDPENRVWAGVYKEW